MINPKKLYCFFREMIWDKRLSVKVTLIILLRLSLSYAQESGPIRIDEQDYCGVCLGDTVVYECTTVGQSAITHYTISGNPYCMLSLRNNRFDSGAADECQNREIIARANRIEGTNFISNVTFTVDISPITVQCRSDTTMNRAKNLNIITSDGFPIQVEVDMVVNPEEQTCVFNWNSSCTADHYKPFTNCSDCTHDDSTVTCSNVRPGEICSISVRQVKCNRTSQESAQVTCVMQAMDLDSEESDPESAPLATIIAPVVVVVVVVMTVVTLVSILLIVVIIKKRRNKMALDISQNCGLANVSDHSDAGSVQMPIAQLSIELTERSENKSETDDKDNGRSVHDESTTQKSPRATYSQVDHGSADDHHRAMDEKESPPVQVSQSCVDQLRQEMNLMKEEVSQRFEDQLHEMRIGNEEMERKLNKLTTAIELKTQELDEKNLLLATKDSKISHLQKIIDQKDKELELNAREVSQKDRELNQRENLIDLQKKTIYELKIERDGLKEEVNSLYNELDHLKKQVGVMQNNMESRNEGERRDEAREKSIREALSKCEGILFETLAKALSVEKTPYKATMQHDSNSSAQPQTQPIVPETKVDKQHTELKFAQEVSHHQDIKNIAEYKNDQHSSHSTSEADTRLDQQVQYDHSISEDNNNSL